VPASRYDITIEAGATFQLRITWRDPSGVPIDLTGYTARMKVKTTYGGTTVFSLTSGSGITLGGIAGTIDILITDTGTAAAIGDSASTCVYDLELISAGGTVTRLIEGKAFLKPEVTD
jgi:hypothetical protein